MAKERSPANIFDVEEILTGFTRSLTAAAEDLHQRFRETSNLPFEYTIPSMKVNLNLSLSYSQGKVKGFIFNKTQASDSQELGSTLELNIKAIPRRNEPLPKQLL